MIQLLMDTSNQYLMVALYKDDTLLDCIQEAGSKRQSENAIPYLDTLLNKHQLSLLDIDEIVITRGPGSYTGQRVAMTIAKTLNVIHPLSVKVISSLASYVDDTKCISVIDARSNKVFIAMYGNDELIGKESLLEIQDAQVLITQNSDYKLVGDVALFNQKSGTVNLCANMHRLSKKVKPAEVVDALVPTYLKDVEAKKIC